MNARAILVFVLCVVIVHSDTVQRKSVRDKRTLDILLKAFADSLGYDVQKRPPATPASLPKPTGPRSMVNPPMAAVPVPAPKAPAPPMPQAPKAPAPAPMPAPKVPAPAPKAPAPAPMPAPAPKAPAPAPKAAPPPPAPKAGARRLPTVPPLLTETVQKMFNINFNWNRNLQTPPPPPAAPKAAPAAPKAAPAPAVAASTPAVPAPSAPAPESKSAAPAPSSATPASTAGPVKHVLYSYDYDDAQYRPLYPTSAPQLKDYDAYYQYDNDDYQQQNQEQAQPEEKQEQLAQDQESQQEEAVNQKENDEQRIEVARGKEQEAFGEAVQEYWKKSPWQNVQQNNYEAVQLESTTPHIDGHSFVVNHPEGRSYSRMEHKKAEIVNIKPRQQVHFQAPIYYYEEEQHAPPLESRSQILEPTNNYHFQGPSFDQYFYSGEQNGDKASIEINASGENGIKQPAESRQKEIVAPEAGLPIPVHNIYQQSPNIQWLSPFEASSENQPKRVKVQSQKAKAKNVGSPFGFNYEPEHYSADFSALTIPPPTQYDYSKYEPAPFKLEDELSDKAQIREQENGRKYTTVQRDDLVHKKY